jgi:hypothetical protein
MNRLVDGAGIVGTAEDYAKSAARLIAQGYRAPKAKVPAVRS